VLYDKIRSMRVVEYRKEIRESEEELRKMLKKEKDARVYMRIKTIYLLKTMSKATVKKVAEKLDINENTVKKYIKLYREGGIENLRLKYKGRIARLSKEGFDSLKEIKKWIREEFNKELSIKTISYWCKKLGIKKKGQTFKYKER